jgi:hypothetical protein
MRISCSLRSEPGWPDFVTHLRMPAFVDVLLILVLDRIDGLELGGPDLDEPRPGVVPVGPGAQWNLRLQRGCSPGSGFAQ